MRSPIRIVRALVVAAVTAAVPVSGGCSSRTLVAVEPCPIGLSSTGQGACVAPADAMVSDARGTDEVPVADVPPAEGDADASDDIAADRPAAETEAGADTADAGGPDADAIEASADARDADTGVPGTDTAATDAGADGPDDAPVKTLRTGLVGLWHFDESPGATMVADASGNGNHGKLVKLDPATVWVQGSRLGNALAVGGLGYVLVPRSPSIDGIVSAVTMSAWIYFEGPLAVDGYATAISRQIMSSYGQYYHLAVWQPDGEPSMFITPDAMANPGHLTRPIATPTHTWTHLAGTYDGKTEILYLNGEMISSMSYTASFIADTTPLILGGNGNLMDVSEFFAGRIDEIALYNRALDPAEIQQLARAVSF